MNGLIPQVYANYLERSWLERVIILPALILFLAFIFSRRVCTPLTQNGRAITAIRAQVSGLR